jgi:predicted DNA-binding transcriptional regulator AlpA
MHPHEFEQPRAPGSRPGQSAPLRNPRQASDYLLQRHGITRSHATLNKLRVVGGGPTYRKIGARNVGYEESALDEWAGSLVSGPLRSTSEAA